MTARRFPPLALSGALLLLAACGAPAGEQAANEAATAPADEAALPSVNDSARATPLPAKDAAPPAPAPTGKVSCAADIGEAAAAALVQQCRSVSPATRPPCNAGNSCALIRSEILRSCSVIDEGGAPVEGCTPPASGRAAGETLRTYYDAIDARDYDTAWTLWDEEGARSGKTYDAFVAGFADTAASQVATGTPGAPEGAAGSSYVTVPVTVTARLADGTRQRFTGSYVLRRSNVERSQGWRLYSAKLAPAR